MNPAADFSRLGSDPAICNALLARLEASLDGRRLRFMEVCGTHTASIFKSGLYSLLPANVRHLSGPGCPVCVTHESEIALLLEIATRKDVILATFGDLLRVPGPDGLSLRQLPGCNARIVYSPLDCIRLAREFPEREIIFAAVGFETTAPAVAATILAAGALANFSLISMHKLIAPALRLLLDSDEAGIDAFLLPGHVATITGIHVFDFIAAEYHKPAAIGGFEPADILFALNRIAAQGGAPAAVENAYQRAVAACGNLRARELLARVFEPATVVWRGLGAIPASGLKVREEFSRFDAERKLGLKTPEVAPQKGCICGAILRGLAQPPQCPSFGGKCQPAHPLGPCMVSTEGSCAAWHKYGGSRC